MLDLTLQKRKVRKLSIQMMKVRDPSFSDEKGMITIVNRLNGSPFRAIYFVSTLLVPLLGFRIFAFCSTRNQVRTNCRSNRSSLWDSMFYRVKRVFVLFTVVWQWWWDNFHHHCPKVHQCRRLHLRREICFVFPERTLAANMQSRLHRLVRLRAKIGEPRRRHRSWHCCWWDNQTSLP